MKKFVLAALAAASASIGLAAAQDFSTMRGFTIDEIRSAVSQMQGVTISKEQEAEGQTLFVITIEQVPFVLIPNCQNGDCKAIAMLGIYPDGLRAGAADINRYNANSAFGWLASDPQSGRIGTRHAAILAGNTKSGLQLNIAAFIGFYAIMGEALSKGGANTVSFDGVEIAPRDRVDVADSRPPTTFAMDQAALKLISSEASKKGLVSILGDAQTYGRLRKISNDILGR